MLKSLKAGDILTARLVDGRFKAVRIVRTIGKSSLVSTSEYLDDEFPKVDDPLLLKMVVQNRFFCRAQPAMKWLDGKPPAGFEYVGNVPPTDEEQAIECGVYGGKWWESSGDEAYLEWRWVHDRPAFEEEVRKQREESDRLRRLPQKPKRMMSDQKFWSIIAALDWGCQGNDGRVLRPAVEMLAAESKPGICQFEERLAYLLYQLDTREHAGNIGEGAYDAETDYVSADGFLYARCVVVANGKEFYEAALKDAAKMPQDLEFESLLGLASQAYELKTGEDFDYTTGCSYESFSNVAGWQRD